MTNRLVIGIDPGQTGALALIADGEFSGFIDMPTKDRASSGKEIDGIELASRLRGVLMSHRGAFVFGVLEAVNPMPSASVDGSARRSMGATSAFRFGESFGVVKGVLCALGIEYTLMHPLTWKRTVGIVGTDKDFARRLAFHLYPTSGPSLLRKKDSGRADALLIGHSSILTEG